MSMYDDDPNRPNRPRVGDPVGNSSAAWGVGILGVLLIAFLAFAFWPTDNRTDTKVTQNAERTERPVTPTTPPANRPTTPTTPSPQK